ncbi:peptide-methionine (S)-S-oxide reductase [Puccinia sorghi]|uniref:peptide-methionine (S)-S-oxide reductase n=1 Tax=Puccinia sorghi TaxID=27349 RepID=A0A0L6UPK0_9BASI|nr:peptide-methionine (S)-S-oxide reductase [Puccinia sorghi]
MPPVDAPGASQKLPEGRYGVEAQSGPEYMDGVILGVASAVCASLNDIVCRRRSHLMPFISARFFHRPSTLGCLLSFPPLANHRHHQKAFMASSAEDKDTAIFASGCFWGTEHIFRQHYGQGKGLLDAKVGYTGGSVNNPTYKQVCTGTTQHAEGVKLEFDPSVVSYAELVEFFYRTHDASHYNHQGPDRGTQYRSAIFYLNEAQHEAAEKVTKEVEEKHYKPQGKSIVTVIEKFEQWWDAEDYHQNCSDIYKVLSVCSFIDLHNNPGGYEVCKYVQHIGFTGSSGSHISRAAM